MKFKNCSILITAFLLIGCTNNEEKKQFYSKTYPDFGVPTNVTPYTVNDTKTVDDSGVFKFHGRHYYNNSFHAEFINFSNSGFEVTFTGTTLEANFLATNVYDNTYRPYLGVCVDNDYNPDNAIPVVLTNAEHSNADGFLGDYSSHPHVVLVHDLPYGKHTVRVYKRSEVVFSKVAVKSVSTDGTINSVEAKDLSLKMEFYGDSVTCGYAVESDDYYEKFCTRTENSMKSYANYAANYLNADVSLISVGGYPMYKSRWSQGNNPDNIPAMFSLADVDWYTTKQKTWDNTTYVPDVVVIALGANDGSYLNQLVYGSNSYNQAIANYKSSYIAFLDQIFQKYPSTQVVISDEILDINQIYYQKMDEIVSEYNAMHTLSHPLLRMNYNAFNLSSDKTLPGEGHPNQTMQHIAGKELALKLSQTLSLNFIDDGFVY